MQIPWLIAYVCSLSVLLPLVLATIQWRKLPIEISPLRWLLVIAPIADISMLTLSRVFKTRNLMVGDIFMFIQFSILLYIFSRQFSRKVSFIIFYACVVIFYIVCFVWPDSVPPLLIGSSAVDGLILIGISIAIFYKLLSELKVMHIHRLPILWIAFATLFYYSGSLFVFLSSNYLEGDREALSYLWMVPNVLNLIKNVLFAIALWQNYKLVKSSI